VEIKDHINPQSLGAFQLTFNNQMDNNLSMAGRIRTKENCPKCKEQFKGNPLHCPTCCTSPKKYFIDLHVKGFGRIKVYSDKQGHPLDSFPRAQRVLESIRYEIDQHVFDPTKYTASDIHEYLFETIDVRDIRSFHIQQFYEQLPEGKSLKYLSNIMKALENFFNILLRYDLIPKKPSFPVITLDRKTPRWVDYEIQLNLLEAIPEVHRPIFKFLAFQGIRPSEARALKVKDINLKQNTLTVARTYSDREIRERVKGKVVKPRLINPAVVPLLVELCRDKTPEAFVFTSPRTQKTYSENVLRRIWDDARKTVGIDITLYEATRHSLASIAASNGASITAIKDVLGHTDIRTTLKYAHNDLESQRVVFQKPHKKIDIFKLNID